MTPTAEFQIQFLKGFQRILKEGGFSSTYKFALLHAIADCCIEKGSDDDSELPLTTMDLAEKFIDIYWSQASVFPNGRDSDVLFQNAGKQAGIIKIIQKVRGGDAKLSSVKSGKQYKTLSKEVSNVIQKMPLWKLQMVGDTPLDFLYPQVGKGNSIKLGSSVKFVG
jgi:hypothetical protein